VRRLLSFPCEGADLAASLDEADGDSALLMVTGGSQTRIGSHRMYERLAKGLSQHGISCFRFDRRGVGDSGGEDPGFRRSEPDLLAAAEALRCEHATLKRVYGFGLCDGATALMLYGRSAALDGLILVNPWLVEADADAPPSAAIRRHYRDRLLSREGWRKILSGAVDYKKLLKGIATIVRPQPRSSLAEQAVAAVGREPLPIRLILATRDATAIAAENELKKGPMNRLLGEARRIDTDSHTFARPGDDSALLAAVLEGLNG